MLKHAITSLLIAAASLLLPLAAGAQTSGSWQIFPSYANPPQKVIDTDRLVYFTSGGNLFSYDKKNDESQSYTIQNSLNGTDITGIYYNQSRRYLVVCYASGNIDLLYDDGRIKNLSDISDSSIPAPLTINDVCFDGDHIYAATAFGVVKFNEPRAEVVTSGNYGKNVSAITVMGPNLLIHTDRSLYRMPKDSQLSTFDKFAKMYDCTAPIQMWADTDESLIFFINDTNGMLSRHLISEPSGNLRGRSVISAPHSVRPTYITRNADGSVYYAADGKLYSMQASAEAPESYSEVLLTSLPDDFTPGVLGSAKGANSVWSLTRDGLANYGFDGEGGTTLLMDRYKPEGITVSLARYFFPSNDEKRLYVQNSGVTTHRFGGSSRGLQYTQSAACINLATGHYEDATAYPVYAQVNEIINRQKSLGNYAIAPVSITELPSDPEVRFIATSDDGIYKVRGTTVEGRYGHLNSPITFIDNRDVVYYCGCDSEGNLWVVKYTDSKTCEPLCILPADKAKLPPEQVTAADWFCPSFKESGYTGGQDIRILFCKKSSLVVIGSNNGRVLVWNTRGTTKDFSDDQWIYLGSKMTDQDGNEITPRQKDAIVEDLDGTIWFGTYEGVFSIAPSRLFSNSPVFTHVKVPRNDGTNLADYLLATDNVVDISVDASNRKWMATTTSGVYCVSPSGDKIIQNFTADNSPLPTDFINCIYADRSGGTIYIGTDNCLLSYSGDTSAPRDSFDEMLIYPNPVRPEFRGYVTISGLMDKSLVKITDSSGALVAQGRSESGSYRWNLCNSSGMRVPAGVYFVMVSQNASGSASGAVGKIMVIN